MEINRDFLDALGFTLVDSLWQGLIIMAVAFLGLVILKKTPARWRHNFLLACILMLPLSGIYSFSQHQQVSIGAVDNISLTEAFVPSAEGLNTGDEEVTTTSQLQKQAFWLVDKAHFIGLLWMLGLVVVSLRGIAGMLHLKRLKSTATEIQQPEVIALLRNLKEGFGLQTEVLIRESSRVMSPLISGYFKPIILFPLGLIQGLTTEEVEVILLHELAHLKRNDYLINIVINGLRAVYFYHPAYWWLQSQLDNEREYATDEMVMSKQSNGLLLVKALAKTQEYKMTTASLGFAGNSKNQLLKRVNRIMKKQQNPNWLSGIFTMLLLCTALILMSQSQQTKKGAKQDVPVVLKTDSLKILNFSPIILKTDSLSLVGPFTFDLPNQKDNIYGTNHNFLSVDTLKLGFNFDPKNLFPRDTNKVALAIQEIVQVPSPITVEFNGDGEAITIKRDGKTLQGDEFKIYQKAFEQLNQYATNRFKNDAGSIEKLAKLAGINFKEHASNLSKLSQMARVDLIEDSVSALAYQQMKDRYDVLNTQEQMRQMDVNQRMEVLKKQSEQLNTYMDAASEENRQKYQAELTKLETYMMRLMKEKELISKEDEAFLKELEMYRSQQQGKQLDQYVTELKTLIEIRADQSSAENTREVQQQLRAFERELEEILEMKEKKERNQLEEERDMMEADARSSSPSTYDFVGGERSQKEAYQVLSRLRRVNQNSIVVLDGKYLPPKALIKLENKEIQSITLSKGEQLKKYSKRKIKGFDTVIDVKTK